MLRRSLLAFSLFLFGCGGEDADNLRPDPAQVAEHVDDAKTAALEWLELVDDGDYGDSWDEAAEFFRGAVDKDSWERQLEGV